MNPELERLLQLYDDLDQSGGQQGQHLEAVFEAHLDDLLEKNPGVAREQLLRMIQKAHTRWLNAQKQPVTLPPRA